MRRLVPQVVVLTLQLLLAACAALPGQTAPPAEAVHSAVHLAAHLVGTNPWQGKRRAVGGEVEAYYERATAAMAAQDWPQATQNLQWLLDNSEGLSGPYLDMALVYQFQNDLESAEHYYWKALQVNPNNLDAYNQYAILLREQGRFCESEEVYMRALQSWDLHAETHRNLGILYDLYMGEKELALQHFERYQTLSEQPDRRVAGWIIDLQQQSLALAGRNQ